MDAMSCLAPPPSTWFLSASSPGQAYYTDAAIAQALHFSSMPEYEYDYSPAVSSPSSASAPSSSSLLADFPGGGSWFASTASPPTRTLACDTVLLASDAAPSTPVGAATNKRRVGLGPNAAGAGRAGKRRAGREASGASVEARADHVHQHRPRQLPAHGAARHRRRGRAHGRRRTPARVVRRVLRLGAAGLPPVRRRVVRGRAAAAGRRRRGGAPSPPPTAADAAAAAVLPDAGLVERHVREQPADLADRAPIARKPAAHAGNRNAGGKNLATL
ncbi:hypothetical protein ACQJBY_010773 [Aegilops geniculata]